MKMKTGQDKDSSGPTWVKSELRHVELRTAKGSVVVKAAWAVARGVATDTHKSPCDFIDFTITSVSHANSDAAEAADGSNVFDSVVSPGTQQSGVSISSSSAALDFIHASVTSSDNSEKSVLMKFILPSTSGYVVRADFLEERLRGCELAGTLKGFVAPDQFCAPRHVPDTDTSGEALLKFLDTCVGVVVVSDGLPPPQDVATELLEDEFINRLAWPWLVPTPLGTKRIVVVGEKRDPAGCERFYRTVKACGVSVVVMDHPGHWMQEPTGPGREYREHFAPFPGFAFDDVAERIVAAIRRLPYTIDGIVTTMDPLLQGVAKAAEMLGLPTSPSEAYRRATNKYETRLMQTSDTMLLVSSTEDLKSQLDDRHAPLCFPLIVKPTRNHGSYGVSKVQTETELYAAVEHAIASVEAQHTTFGAQAAETDVIVETYCAGPETDVNLTLWNGELLFSEVVDNFPCVGDDASGPDKTEQFVETGSAWPSGLPHDEVELLRAEMLDIVKRLGSRTGVIHVEAKMNNSAFGWDMDRHRVLDLAPRAASSRRPRSFLLEINPRAPGQSDSAGSAYVNGVDYYALYVMQAIGDETRFRSLACPFLNGPQCYLATSPIPIRSSGRLSSDISIESISRGYPEISSSMLMLHPLFRKGELIPDRDGLRLPWLGFCALVSRRGRRDLMEKVMTVRDELQFEVAPVSALREHKLSSALFAESK